MSVICYYNNITTERSNNLEGVDMSKTTRVLKIGGRAVRRGAFAVGRFFKFTAKKWAVSSKTARLNDEISSKEKAIENIYAEIGKTYFEANREKPDAFLSQFCSDIQEQLSGIEDVRDKIRALQIDFNDERAAARASAESMREEDMEAARLEKEAEENAHAEEIEAAARAMAEEEDLFATVKEKGSDAEEQAEAAANSFVEDPVILPAMEEHFFDEVKQASEETAAIAEELFGETEEAVEQAADTVETAAEEVAEEVEDAVESAAEEVGNAVEEAAGQAEEAADAAAEAAGEVAEEIVNKAEEAADAAAEIAE